MRNFKELYEETRHLTEARSRGEAMEEVIVAAMNGKPEPKSAIQMGIPKGAGVKIAKELKRLGVSGKAEVLGASQLEVTKKWAKYWEPESVPASTKTPKTDFKIGKSYKISLKTGGAAQLMSGGKNESIATFYAAVEGSGVDITGIVKKIETAMHNLSPSSLAQSDLKSEIKKGKDKVVVAANNAHKVLMSDMKKVVAEIPSFGYHFAKEAMTGKIKFGGSDGTCNYFLCVSDDGSKIKLVPTTDSAYIDKVAKKMKISVRFKTTSEKTKEGKTGRYRYWSAIGLIVNKLTEEISYYEDRGEVLTEGIIGNIWNKVVSFVKNLVSGIVDWISQSWKNVIEFLGMEPDVDVSDLTGDDLLALA